jgi:large subunit ribosomal protein L21
MSYAVLEASGRQFWVEVGKFYDLNYLALDPGDIVSFPRVLLASSNGNILLGTPCIENASVNVVVLGQLRSKKLIVYKMKSKKKTRKKQGHRNTLTRILVTSIVL